MEIITTTAIIVTKLSISTIFHFNSGQLMGNCTQPYACVQPIIAGKLRV